MNQSTRGRCFELTYWSNTMKNSFFKEEKEKNKVNNYKHGDDIGGITDVDNWEGLVVINMSVVSCQSTQSVFKKFYPLWKWLSSNLNITLAISSITAPFSQQNTLSLYICILNIEHKWAWSGSDGWMNRWIDGWKIFSFRLKLKENVCSSELYPPVMFNPSPPMGLWWPDGCLSME